MLELSDSGPSSVTMTLGGEWSKAVSLPSPDLVGKRLAGRSSVRELIVDAVDLGTWDSALLAFVRRVDTMCRGRGIAVDQSRLPAGIRHLLALAGPAPVAAAGRRPTRRPLLATVGCWALRIASELGSGLALLGELAMGVPRLVRGRADIRWIDTLAALQQCGFAALPIVAIISLLVGMILAFVGAVQLRQFGAQIYVADLVAVAVTREMAPIMTGIVLAGRSGAAFAAEIGAMEGNEEIDALSTVGLRPVEFLVLPRVLALALMTPLLCLYADATGMLGGFLVSAGMLNIDGAQYLLETAGAVDLGDVAIGLVKAGVFGVLVALAGCRRGLSAGRSAAAVGGATTSAVVAGILQIIIADAIFAVVLNVLGL